MPTNNTAQSKGFKLNSLPWLMICIIIVVLVV